MDAGDAPDAFAVLEATVHPATRVVRLDDGTVLRTSDRPDHSRGNALHLDRALAATELSAALDDLDRRFPTGRARLVVDHDPALAGAVGERADVRASSLDVLVGGGSDRPGASDVQLAAPRDDRAWHGITVLHRHAGPPGEDRSRGAADDRIRWWVDGTRRLVQEGRARVLRAERFGTPVGAGVLYWDPGAEVGQDHAGLAVVADVVVHPAHRGLGVARAIVDGLAAAHLDDFPRSLLAGLDEQPGGAVATRAPAGWQPHRRLLAVTRDRGPGDA